MFHVPNQYRVRDGYMASQDSIGNSGAFIIPSPTRNNRLLRVIASDGFDWEHVSISAGKGKSHILMPYWDEMCYIKDLFWDDTDTVIQYHPRKEDYVNFADCLHLWRPVGVDLPTPPKFLV